MDNVNQKVIFYDFKSNVVDLSKITSTFLINGVTPIGKSKDFNDALRTVIKKDIDALSDRLEVKLSDITKRLALNGTILNKPLNGKIEEIDEVIKEIETLISNLIIEKNNIKVGVFTTNKKQLKDKIKKLDDSVEFLAKSQNDIISIKDEYNKLVKRSLSLKSETFDTNTKDDKIKEDPLERTINFYMNRN